MAQKHLFIICGEASGDLHAASLAKEILRINPRIKISGVGGQALRQAGAQVFCDIKDLSVIGLFDVLKNLPKFLALKKLILEKIGSEKPDAAIFVDFSGFNLRLAKAINNILPTIYYISPQVWASRPGRIHTIKKYISKIIVFFKFEREFYQKYGVSADLVGHPLLDIVKPAMERGEFLRQLGLAEEKTTIALLPGSRVAEIKNILSLMLKSAALISRKLDAQYIIAKAPSVNWDIYQRPVKKEGINLKIAEGRTYDCLNACDFALVASGTATLETAIMQKPFVIIYKMDLANYLLYRPQIRLPYIGMANIVAGKKIIPEFIQFRARPQKISRQVLKILKNPAELEKIKTDLAQVKASLGSPGAASRAARIIIDFLK
ncbi:MAG: lipid-A-disaccharide synthase [Candidatus Omnitrophica bacterium]|nr:lipid-A-disaccharide synthase [Candidatus Omnitrophota bacterium]